jgi:NAD(P)-dependent dehydrogenase (short-subunit alcohol dehydrogenase family)
LKKAQAALGELTALPNVHLLSLNFNSLASVRACTAEFLSKSSKLNTLTNNAEVMAMPEDGFETQFGVNHMAHFLLFNLLKQALLTSPTADFYTRVASIASQRHRFSKVIFNIINLEGIYDPDGIRSEKLAIIWFERN